MDGTTAKNYLKDYISRAKPILIASIEDEIKSAQHEEMGELPLRLLKDYSLMLTEGKGLRGALIELTYKACGGEEGSKILYASTFIELFHAAILIHDDFMDKDPFRRGIESIHKKYERYGKETGVKISPEHFGNSIAVSIGDSGLYYSWKTLLNSKFDANLLIKAGQVYSDYIGRLGLGQALDMTITGNDSIDEKEALKVLYLKSVEYTSILPMKIGAILAGEQSTEKISAIENYARCFGWAFQIQDDVLGLFADEVELGKPVGSDLREGKNTLLMINLRKNGTKEQRDFQHKILGNQSVTKDDVEKMRQILRDSGTLDHVLQLGWDYVSEGKKYIPAVTSDKDTAFLLESLITYMMSRTK